MDINEQINNQLAELETEVKQIGYGEFVKPPVLKVGGVDYSNEVYMPDDGRALDGSMHRTKLQLVVDGKRLQQTFNEFELQRSKG